MPGINGRGIMKIISITELERFREELKKDESKKSVSVCVCAGTGCGAGGAGDVLAELSSLIRDKGLAGDVSVVSTGCHGFCENGPLVVVRRAEKGAEKGGNILYQRVKPEDVKRIVEHSVMRDGIVEDLLYKDPQTGRKIAEESEVPFYKYQKRLLLACNGRINPRRIEDYIVRDGYKALAKALQMKPDDILTEIEKSGLRGRGGAGFPTGKKWSVCRDAILAVPDTASAHIVCNADEGDPGAFMDRSLIEGNPHSVIEGMIIGAYAICSGTQAEPRGYVYIRYEYPLALEHLTMALEQARERGMLGEDILGSGFSFDIRIHPGAGAFVCGEETALIASIENKIGRPTPRPPYPAEKGISGQPTNINNTKTWANVPIIINNGAAWYSNIGTKTSPGTMIFSLVGKIANSGLIEVPMGITLREILYKIGGGTKDKTFKVQVGGPSGGLIPDSMLDIPIDYESLAAAGSMMGSGGLIVSDETTCMVGMARYFLSFTQEESCGKCTPCREGTKYMLRILEKIVAGKANEVDLAVLEETANMVQASSLCGLGKTAPNPVLSTLRHFRQEYVEHIVEKKCRAKACQALIEYSIRKDKCTGCALCMKNCPYSAISGSPKEPHGINAEKCAKCGVCLEMCRFDAIEVR